jgi:hypothetical protein
MKAVPFPTMEETTAVPQGIVLVGVFASHAMRADSAHPECRPRAGSLIEAPRVA